MQKHVFQWRSPRACGIELYELVWGSEDTTEVLTALVGSSPGRPTSWVVRHRVNVSTALSGAFVPRMLDVRCAGSRKFWGSELGHMKCFVDSIDPNRDP